MAWCVWPVVVVFVALILIGSFLAVQARRCPGG
jgi:hypothetical protein